jgi:hypothetical protein
MKWHPLLQSLLLMIAAGPALADRITPAKQIYTQVYIRAKDAGRPEEVKRPRGNAIWIGFHSPPPARSRFAAG